MPRTSVIERLEQGAINDSVPVTSPFQQVVMGDRACSAPLRERAPRALRSYDAQAELPGPRETVARLHGGDPS